MITDSRLHIRELGLRKILVTRSFEVSPLNFEVSDYIDLVNWNDYKPAKPPICSDLSNEKGGKMGQTGEKPEF